MGLLSFKSKEIFFPSVSSANDSGFLIRWFLIPILRPILEDMRIMEEYLANSCDDINYTVIRPPQLTNGNVTGNYIIFIIAIYICKNKIFDQDLIY